MPGVLALMLGSLVGVLAPAASSARGSSAPGSVPPAAPGCAVRIDSPLDPRGLYRYVLSYATAPLLNTSACAARCCDDLPENCTAFTFAAAPCGTTTLAFPDAPPAGGTAEEDTASVTSNAVGGTTAVRRTSGCEVSRDAPGSVRQGTYFAGVSSSAATGSVDACSALCCGTPGCRAFSLDSPWNLTPGWFGCVVGKPCCALSASVDGPVVKRTYPGMEISSGTVAKPPGSTPGCCMLQQTQGPLLPNTGVRMYVQWLCGGCAVAVHCLQPRFCRVPLSKRKHQKPSYPCAIGRPARTSSPPGPHNITSGTVDRTPAGTAAAAVKFRNAGTPLGVPIETDCALRQLAWEYGVNLRPDKLAAGFPELFDALQLAACNGTGAAAERMTAARSPPRPRPGRRSPTQHDSRLSAAAEFFVSVSGDDAAAGSISAPFATPQRGVLACRAYRNRRSDRGGNGAPGQLCVVTLRAGRYVIKPRMPLTITAEDGFLTVRSFEGEEAELTGAVPLEGLEWERASHNGTGARDVAIWAASVPLAVIPALRVAGVRVPQGRYPNIADMEAQESLGALEGFITQPGVAWLEPSFANSTPGVDHVSTAADWPDVEWIATNNRPFGSPYGTPGIHYQGTGGGACSSLDVTTSYWCGTAIPRGQNYLHRTPVGLANPAAVLPNAARYRNETVGGAVVHMWRTNDGTIGTGGVNSGLWFTLQMEVTHIDADGALVFDPTGGTQGSEGFDGGGPFFIENVLEEVDAPLEWYFDAPAQRLYFASNSSTGAPPTDADQLEAVQAEVLVNITGSQAAPVLNVTFSGITLRDTAPTFLTPHELPSGGDWGLVHTAAVYARGTKGLSIENCVVTRVDGQAILLDGYHRGASVVQNDIELTGSHGVVVWGKTSPCMNSNCSRQLPDPRASGPDGRAGNQPIGTLVEANIIRETGVLERHGTMFFSSLAANTVLKGNVLLNAMRAGVNINDGFGGGNRIEGNLMANIGRGWNKDEGVINAWARQPFITNLRNGTASTQPAFNVVNGNFILATYSPLLGVDTDDCSSFWTASGNVLAYGGYGRKGSEQSTDVNSVGNFMFWMPRPTYAGGSGPAWSDQNGVFANNTVVLSGGPDPCNVPSGYASDCLPHVYPGLNMSVTGNTILAAEYATLMVPSWCATNVTVLKWIAEGHDRGSSLGPLPSKDAVISSARSLLGLPPPEARDPV